MKSLISLRAGAMMLMLILLSGTSAWADVDDYVLSVRNVTHTTNTIEFDLYLLDADNTQTFEFAALQMGLLLNSSIYGSGILTVSYSNTGSGLDGDQQFVGSADVVGSLAGYPGQALIRLMPNSIPPVPPGAGSGTVISAIGNGTFLTHFTITSSVSFTPNTRPDLIFCASSDVSPLYPTVVSAYINGDATPLTVTPGVDAIVDGNPILNATLPTLFNVTGTGDYCEGGAGLPVGLDGSEVNTTYTLYRGLDEVSSIPGTGSALSFGTQTEGTYTIYATNDAGSIQMTGEAVITAVINTVSPPSSAPTLCINTLMTSITHSTTGATGIGLATGLPAGVTAAWASNTITISGTPTESGTFNYTIPLTGGCGSVSATGTITVTAANTVGAASSTPTVCLNTALTSITHSTTGATGIGVATGLPSGVTAALAGNTLTISGTPTVSGIFNYSIPLTGGCGSVSATGTITVTETNTVGAASSTPTLCINTALTSITHSTTGATGIGTPSNLPAGVSAAWASNAITISGTPSAAGTFNYSIQLVGGCGSVNATGTISVTAANTITLTSGVGTNNQTVCNGTAITNITYSTTGATGATVTGLPTGVTGNWSGGVVTISGTPSATGTFGYTVTLTGGCGVITANGTINVNALPSTSVITGSATPACSATGVSYSVTSTAGSTYTWTVPAGATVATGQGTNSITVNFGTTNGNISVTERNAAGCDGTLRTLTISLQGCGLSADFGATPRSVCIGSAVLFTNLSTGTSGSTVYSWNFGSEANPLTITGPGPHSVTYSTSGSKDVSLTITEGATDVETKVGYITVIPNNSITLTSGVGTNNQTVCVNTAITTITYSTTGATGATFSGLPAGVNAIWSANVVTISGTPTTDGIYNYSVTLTGGCGNVSASGTITVNVCSKTLTLTSVFLEGLYNGSGVMRQSYDEFGPRWPAGIADQINVELHNSTNYSTIVYTAADVELSTAGSAAITIPALYSGSYYITVKNRNHIETTTSLPVSFSNATISYAFDNASKAYGGNLKRIDEAIDHFVIYGGDSNGDGVADGLDLISIENGATLFSSGYLPVDLNGDGIVDALDLILVENNALNFVMIILP